MTESSRAEPLFHVVAGDPTAEELAALVAVLSAMRSGAADAVTAAPSPRPVSAWSAPGRHMPPTLHPGVGGWRLSAFPH